MATNLLAAAVYYVVTVMLYQLYKPVSPTGSLVTELRAMLTFSPCEVAILLVLATTWALMRAFAFRIIQASEHHLEVRGLRRRWLVPFRNVVSVSEWPSLYSPSVVEGRFCEPVRGLGQSLHFLASSGTASAAAVLEASAELAVHA